MRQEFIPIVPTHLLLLLLKQYILRVNCLNLSVYTLYIPLQIFSDTIQPCPRSATSVDKYPRNNWTRSSRGIYTGSTHAGCGVFHLQSMSQTLWCAGKLEIWNEYFHIMCKMPRRHILLIRAGIEDNWVIQIRSGKQYNLRIIFPWTPLKHMLWSIIRTISLRWF